MQEQPPKEGRWMRLGVTLSAIAAGCGLLLMTVTAILKVRAGEGQERWRTFWLVEMDHIGFLALLAATVLALLGAAIYAARERRQWRSLERKYGRKEPESSD